MIGIAAVLVVAVIGVTAWREISDEIEDGPNRFVLSSGSSRPGHVERSYRTFSGLLRETATLQEGQALDLVFSAEVTKGSVSVEVKDPAGRDLWRVNVPTDAQREVAETLVADQTGPYQIVVTGLDAGGSFDLAWSNPEN